MAGTEPLIEKKDAKTALEDETVRLLYDMYHKLAGMVEQMQGMDETTDENEEELAGLREAENELLARVTDWLQAHGVPDPWQPVL